MRLDSLAVRLFAAAGVWAFVVLPLAGVIIFSLYRQDASQAFDDRIKTLLTVVLADSIETNETVPRAPKDVGEPLFEITHSGWYWQIRPLDTPGPSEVSASLASEALPSPFDAHVNPDDQGYRWIEAPGPLGRQVRICEIVYSYGEEGSPSRYAVSVAGPVDWLEARLSSFRTRLFSALALAGLGLVAVTWLQARFGLAPLRDLERGLANVRSGAARRLEGRFPAEIAPLASELNQLLTSNEEIIERARTQVGNLAHALKTPLAVITNESGSGEKLSPDKVAEQARIMGDQIRHYLERARRVAGVRAIGHVTDVAPVARSLQRVLTRIHADRGIVVELDCPPEARFAGERQDLEEMIGNLADNACKWATSKARISVAVEPQRSRASPRRVTIRVEDDGKGVPVGELEQIGRRGVRLDETTPGSGLGLSIVQDLAQSYRGSLTLSTSPLGGLAADLSLPSV